MSIAINGAANDDTESLGSTNVSELRDPSPQPLQVGYVSSNAMEKV